MGFDILTYNNNINNNGGSHNNDDININININNGLKPTKIAKLENDSKIVFSNVGCYQHDDHDHDHMLSFSSSSKLESNNINNNASWQNGSYCKSSFYNNVSFSSLGYSCFGGSMSASMYVMNGGKGPFTPSQWLELEHQAMIYKYIIANESIPPNLLISIIRAFESSCFSTYNGAFFGPNSFGWGPFYLGFTNSTDPEPGRCRRTDGKKWRCSRDAVPDQKYCERHMNRGRHRSRKPVEGQVGRSTSTTNFNKTNPTTNLANTTPSPLSELVVPGGGGSSNNFAIALNQNKDLHPVTSLDFASATISLNSTFSIDKEHNLYEESVGTGGFAGLKCDTLMNSIHKNPYNTSSYDLDALQSDPLNSDQSTIPWQTHSNNATHLSITIPIPLPPDFMSSTSSPTGERITPVSPLRPFEMGLNVGAMKQSNWVPESWETFVGGPLGEVLKTSSNSSDDHKKNETSSPSNVLQRTALCSLSTSSGGSSPQAENGGP